MSTTFLYYNTDADLADDPAGWENERVVEVELGDLRVGDFATLGFGGGTWEVTRVEDRKVEGVLVAGHDEAGCAMAGHQLGTEALLRGVHSVFRRV